MLFIIPKSLPREEVMAFPDRIERTVTLHSRAE